jgi:hypothetical protein
MLKSKLVRQKPKLALARESLRVLTSKELERIVALHEV